MTATDPPPGVTDLSDEPARFAAPDVAEALVEDAELDRRRVAEWDRPRRDDAGAVIGCALLVAMWLLGFGFGLALGAAI